MAFLVTVSNGVPTGEPHPSRAEESLGKPPEPEMVEDCRMNSLFCSASSSLWPEDWKSSSYRYPTLTSSTISWRSNERKMALRSWGHA